MVTQTREQTEQERENEEVLSAMLGEAEKGPEPGTLRVRDVINKGDEDLPPPMVAKVLTSAGYRWIYDRATGDRSLTNVNMLPSQLKKKNVDGNLMFAIHPPKNEDGTTRQPFRGTLRCLLHPEDENRARWDTMGYAVCRKANIPSPFMVEMHMQKRHGQVWAAIQRDRQEAREAKRIKLEEEILRQAARGGSAPVPFPEEPETPRRGRPPKIPGPTQ